MEGRPLSVALDVALIAAGVGLVVSTLLSAIRIVVLPRAASTMIGRLVFPVARRVFLWLAARRKDFEAKDRVLALHAPTVLLALPFVWSTLIAIGYALVFMAVADLGFYDAFHLSGSSLLTLGFADHDGVVPMLLIFSEAAIGLMIVALLITFLPSLYSAYNQREIEVNTLEVRAGVPPNAAEMIIRHDRIMGLDTMVDSYVEWERWFVELEETHTAFPILVFFRGPHAHRSWLTSAGAVLDGAALLLAAVEGPQRRPKVELALRAGFIALRRIADLFKIPYDPDPAPDDPISISRDEFDAILDQLREGGVELRADEDQAWRDYAGWRVNYDATLLGLAELIVAPHAPWTSDRKPVVGT